MPTASQPRTRDEQNSADAHAGWHRHQGFGLLPGDDDVYLDETLGALSDLVRAGKLRAIGTSTFPAEQLVEAQWVAQQRSHVRFRVEQAPYSLLTRGVEPAVLPTCARYGTPVIAWSPLRGGVLSGRFRNGATDTGVLAR